MSPTNELANRTAQMTAHRSFRQQRVYGTTLDSTRTIVVR